MSVIGVLILVNFPQSDCVLALKGLPAHVACVYTLAAAPVLFAHAAVAVAENNSFCTLVSLAFYFKNSVLDFAETMRDNWGTTRRRTYTSYHRLMY